MLSLGLDIHDILLVKQRNGSSWKTKIYTG